MCIVVNVEFGISNIQHCSIDRQQHYDVTGVAGHFYALISDELLLLNARFDVAYTTGLYVDEQQTLWNMRPKGTWMTEIGVATGDSVKAGVVSGFHTIAVLSSGSTIWDNSARKRSDIMNWGSVQADGVHLAVGLTKLDVRHIRIVSAGSCLTHFQ